MNRIQTYCSATVLGLALLAGPAIGQEAPKPDAAPIAKAAVKIPKRVLIAIFDQMRPEYAPWGHVS